MEKTQRFLMYARAYANHGLTWLGIAEAIRLTYAEAGVPWLAPVLPIDDDATNLDLVRRDSRKLLHGILHRPPTIPELAAEVVRDYNRDERAVERALAEMKRMITDAKHHEYVLPGLTPLPLLPPSR